MGIFSHQAPDQPAAAALFRAEGAKVFVVDAKPGEGVDFTAEKLDPADKDKPKIVSYRGHTLLD